MALVETELLPIMILWISEALSCLGVGFFFPVCECCLTMQGTNKVMYCKSQKIATHILWGSRWKKVEGSSETAQT